jgi:type VII secretion integral membrane protein EccD
VSTIATNDLCRLTVVTPTRRADLAVPTATRVAELLPAILVRTESGAAANGHGWVLQRLGDEPLAEDGTPASLDLRDGEVLYLRPREAPLAPIDLDDVVAGVGAAIQDRRDTWRPGLTRRVMLGLSGLALLTVLALLLLAGPAVLRSSAAGGIAVLLMGGSALASRVMGDGAIAVLLGMFSVPFAALCGLLLPGDGGPFAEFGGANLLIAGAFVVSAVGLVLLGGAPLAPMFLAVAVLGLSVALGGGLVLLGMARWPAAALVAVLAVLLSLLAPGLALRLVRLRLPQLPREARELQDDIEPVPEDRVLAAARQADHYLSAFCGGVCLVCVICFALLAQSPGWEGRTLSAVLCGVLLLRARALVGAVQRISLVAPAVAGVAAMAFVFAARADIAQWIAAICALTGTAALAVVGTWRLPGRQFLPFWGRAADITETVLTIASVPLLLAVMDVYTLVRGLFG